MKDINDFISSTLDESITAINEIEKLEQNWNGYGAEPVPKELISIAKDLVLRLILQPKILPTQGSTIQMEFETKNGDYLEIEIMSDKSIKIFEFSVSKDIKKLIKNVHASQVNEIVCTFFINTR